MNKIFLGSILFSTLLLVQSCSKDSSDNNSTSGNTIDCNGAVKTFSTDANPLIQTFCNLASCHASGSSNGPGPLTNYTQVFNARSAIRSAVVSGGMPRNTTLTLAQKTAIVCWIDSGAPNN